MSSTEDLKRAKELLETGNFTCVFVCGEKEITAKTRGVKPLLDLYESGQDFSSYSAADKVVGNGAAWLYTMLGVKQLFCHVISNEAKTTLNRHNIDFEYGKLVPMIKNHDKTGYCPVETAVRNCSTQHDAFAAIKEQLHKMGISPLKN